MYDARNIANWFVNRAARDSRKLSIMSLLKLVYIAHGWYLETRKTPLFKNKIEAWQRGPVIPDVYSAFRAQGIDVSFPVSNYSGEVRPDDSSFLNEIFTIYGHRSPFELSDLTHEPGGPWELASRRGGHYAPMFDQDIQKHYEEKRAKSQV